MDLKELYQLVKKGEGQTLEFKRKVAHPEKIIREAVAFANTVGGDLLIGVDDNGTIPGVKYAEEEIYVLNKALQALCKPHIKYSYEIIPLDENELRAVVYYRIEESKKKLHYALPDENSTMGKAYVRSADKSIQASNEVKRIIKLSQRKTNKAFSIGEKEKLLLSYLSEHNQITLTQFQALTQLNKSRTSQILVAMVVANLVNIHPSDKEDVYTLSASLK